MSQVTQTRYTLREVRLGSECNKFGQRAFHYRGHYSELEK